MTDAKPEDGVHPNIAILSKVNVADIEGCAEIFAPDVIWHFYNPRVPDLHGDHKGVEGLANFFKALGGITGGTFNVTVVDARPVGDELVVVQTCNRLTLDGEDHAFDVVVVWRVVDGLIKEVWDIPSLYTASTMVGAIAEDH